MKPKIVFVVMSAVAKAGTVDQLARSLAPHTALVHHDFSQTPDFRLTSPNVVFVPNPKRTGWAVFGFVEAIFHSLQYAVENLEFDYLQILSQTCLPIKSMEQFEAHIQGDVEAHYECVDLFTDRDAFMTVGYRAFTPEHSFRFRVARRLSREYFGESPGRRDLAGVWLRSGFDADGRGRMSLKARAALAAYKLLGNRSIGRHIFDENFHPYYGTDWIGARPHLIQALVEGFARPDIHQFFSRVRIAEEFVVPTLLKQTGAREGPMNHYIQKFDQSRAGLIQDEHFEQLRNSPKFFGRKFPDDPESPIRRRVLEELVGMKDTCGASAV